MLRSQHRVYDDSGEVARTQDVWGAEGISGRVKFLPLAWAGMPKTSFRKNSDSPLLSTGILNSIAVSGPVQWKIADGGNDHWYEVFAVPDSINWTDAKAAAEAIGSDSHLATITSAEENEFIFSLVSHYFL